MTKFKAPKEETGVEELRHIVQNFNSCRESFLDPFTTDQLVQIHRAWMASGWDIYPDEWASWQIKNALKGIVPEWNDDESPKRPSKAA